MSQTPSNGREPGRQRHPSRQLRRNPAVEALPRLLTNDEELDEVIASAMSHFSPIQAAMLALAATESATTKVKKKTLANRLLEAVGPSSQPAVKIALCEALEVEHDEMVNCFRKMSLDEVDALIERGPQQVRYPLIILSAIEGHDVIPIARSWLAKGTSKDARGALIALDQSPQQTARQLVIGALQHEDYDVRREAIKLLAKDADIE